MRSTDDSEGTSNLAGHVSTRYLWRWEVDQFQVALLVYQEVLGFYVSADDLYVLEVFQDQDNASCVELGVWGREQTQLFQHLVKLLPFNVLSKVN